MRNLLFGIIVCLCMNAARVFGEVVPAKPLNLEPGEDEMKIIAVMDLLEVMDLAEDMDMMRDLDFLIEENKNENKN